MYDFSDINNVFLGNPFHFEAKSKQWVKMLLTSNADGSDKLPPLVAGKYRVRHHFNNAKTSRQI